VTITSCSRGTTRYALERDSDLNLERGVGDGGDRGGRHQYGPRPEHLEFRAAQQRHDDLEHCGAGVHGGHDQLRARFAGGHGRPAGNYPAGGRAGRQRTAISLDGHITSR